MAKRPYVAALVDKTPVKLLIFTPEFFFIPMKKIKTVADPVANRTYFMVNDRIMAVGDLPREAAR